MDHGDRPVPTHRVPNATHLGETDRGVDGVLDALAATAELDHQEPDRTRIDTCDDTSDVGNHGQLDRRPREVSVEIGRAHV